MSAEFGGFLKLYHVAFKKLLKQLEKLPENERKSARDQIEEMVEDTVSQLDQNAANHIPTICRTAYKAAAKAVHAQIGPDGTIGPTLNIRLINLLAENSTDQLVEAHHMFGRRTMDRVRDIDLAVVGEGLSGIRDTRREIGKRLKAELEQDGMTFLPTADGRKMDLRSYADLVAVTTSREATNTGTIETTKDLGHDLVQCTETNTACAVCAAVMGRIYSISGKDERFDALFSVPGFDRGFKTIHPRCKHNFVPVVWDLMDEEEQQAALARAHQPFDKDPRTKEQIDLYNARQQEKRQRWRDRRQWEKYKARLGDNRLPKNLTGFRKLKKTKKWDQYQELYKLKGIANRGINFETIKSNDDVFPYAIKIDEFVLGAPSHKFVPKDAVITDVHVIAGPGLKTPFRSAKKRSRDFGGNPANWIKKVGKIESEEYNIDVHWEENVDVGKVNYKVKRITRKEQ